MKKFFYVPMAIIIVLWMVATMMVAIPAAMFTWWHSDARMRKKEEPHVKYDEIYSGARAPWNRSRRTH